MLVMHLQSKGGGAVAIPLPEDWNALAYVIRGQRASADMLRQRQMAVFVPGSGAVELDIAADSDVLLLAGEPIDEPVVSWGPFVMNTREEIMQAHRDYASGRMGVVPPRA